MFGIFKKKKKNVEEVYSPCLGRIVQIEDVPDPVFSEKMMIHIAEKNTKYNFTLLDQVIDFLVGLDIKLHMITSY